MELVKKFLLNGIVIKNLGTLAGVLLLFGMAFLFNGRYNKGASDVNLWAARVSAIIGCIIIVVWFFV